MNQLNFSIRHTNDWYLKAYGETFLSQDNYSSFESIYFFCWPDYDTAKSTVTGRTVAIWKVKVKPQPPVKSAAESFLNDLGSFNDLYKDLPSIGDVDPSDYKGFPTQDDISGGTIESVYVIATMNSSYFNKN